MLQNSPLLRYAFTQILIHRKPEADPKGVDLMLALRRMRGKSLRSVWKRLSQHTNCLDRLFDLLTYLQHLNKQIGFERISFFALNKYQIRLIKGAYKLKGLNSIVDQQKMYGCFSTWSNLMRNMQTHPWILKSANYLAKNPRINFQIAFWRIRDFDSENAIGFITEETGLPTDRGNLDPVFNEIQQPNNLVEEETMKKVS